MTDFHDVIAAFVDGERVEPDRLKHALSEPEGLDYLVDVLALRELVNAPTVTALAVPRSGGSPSSSLRTRWLSAAAALVCLSALGGYVIGHRTTRSAQRTLEQTFATAEPAHASSLPLPAPTRVIRLQSGVDWQEHAGGQ